MNHHPVERRFKTSGLEYAALCWGDPTQPLVIALHGWLDNALSFVKLAPLLNNHYVVAVDLSGHGLSSWRSVDSTYHIWDDLPQLVDVIDELAADYQTQRNAAKVALVGHSRGASVATLLACALGERCTSLTLIDGLLPAWGDKQNGAHQLRRFVDQRRGYMSRKARFLHRFMILPNAENSMVLPPIAPSFWPRGVSRKPKRVGGYAAIQDCMAPRRSTSITSNGSKSTSSWRRRFSA